MELRIPASQLSRLSNELLSAAPEESAAFLSVRPAGSDFVLRSVRTFHRKDLEGGEHGELSLSEAAQIDGLAEIKRAGHGLIEVHTHPMTAGSVHFSAFDDRQLPAFARYIGNKLPGRIFGAIVLGPKGYDARVWTGTNFDRLGIKPVGERNAHLAWLSENSERSTDARFDRQIRALGPEGQRILASMRIGVVGLGGTGSQIIQQLAHLGIRELVVIDPDRVEATNLPRLAGATWWDVVLRRKKTSIARRQAKRVRPGIRLRVAGDLRSTVALSMLKEVDLLVGCVDNDGARLILTELAAAYLIPYLDIGVGIENEDSVPSIGGRIAFFLPGGPCLSCADELDMVEVAEDLEGPAQRALRIKRGYARDRRIEPALMPLNTVLVGLAMTELLACVTGIRNVVPFLRFDSIANRITTQNVDLDTECAVCGPARGMGDDHGIERYCI